MRPVTLTHAIGSGTAMDESGMVSAYGSYSNSASGSLTASGGYHEAGGSFGAGGAFGSNMHGSTASVAGMVAPASSPTTSRKDNDFERSLVGSLTNSYPFMKEGLCKEVSAVSPSALIPHPGFHLFTAFVSLTTSPCPLSDLRRIQTISIQVEGSTQHLISYYSVEDVRNGRLRTPSSLPEIAALCISPIFLNKSNFRNPPHIEVGPDGIPRYRGDSVEGPAARMSGHHSGSESASSGSDSRDAKSLSSPGSALVAYSPSTATDASFFDSYYRHPHQIGGSGTLQTSNSTGNLYTASTGSRRTSDVQLRRSGSRYEPYSVSGGHHAYSTPGSPYMSPTTGSYYPGAGHSTALVRKGSASSSSSSRNWLLSSSNAPLQHQMSPTSYYQSGSTIGAGSGPTSVHGGLPLAHDEQGSGEGSYGFNSVGGGNSSSHMQATEQALTVYQPRMNQTYQSGGLSSSSGSSNAATIKSELVAGNCDGLLPSGRSYRGSWDANQASSLYSQQDAPGTGPMTTTSQGLTALSLYAQSSVSGSGMPAEDARSSPPPTSSSYSSHHSFISHAHLPQTSLSSGSAAVDGALGAKLDSETNANGGWNRPSLSGASMTPISGGDEQARRSITNMGTSYDMPPPTAPSQRWQAYDSSQASIWPSGSEAERADIKREDLWDSSGGSASKYRQDESHSRPSSATGAHHRRTLSGVVGTDDVESSGGGGVGLEKVVLTKPAS